MKINIRRDVFIDTEVSISTEDIAEAIADAMSIESSRAQVLHLLTMCWQTLHGFTPQQIDELGAANRPHVVSALRSLADRFERAQ